MCHFNIFPSLISELFKSLKNIKPKQGQYNQVLVQNKLANQEKEEKKCHSVNEPNKSLTNNYTQHNNPHNIVIKGRYHYAFDS